MHSYVTGYKFGMMVLVSLYLSVVALTLLEEARCPGLGLGLGLERFGLDNNTVCILALGP